MNDASGEPSATSDGEPPVESNDEVAVAPMGPSGGRPRRDVARKPR